MRKLVNKANPLLTFINFTGILLSNFSMNFATQMIYCVVYGFTGGAYRGLTPVVAIDIMGMKKFVLGYGVQLLFMGIAMMIGPTVTGVVHFLALLSSN